MKKACCLAHGLAAAVCVGIDTYRHNGNPVGASNLPPEEMKRYAEESETIVSAIIALAPEILGINEGDELSAALADVIPLQKSRKIEVV